MRSKDLDASETAHEQTSDAWPLSLTDLAPSLALTFTFTSGAVVAEAQRVRCSGDSDANSQRGQQPELEQQPEKLKRREDAGSARQAKGGHRGPANASP